MAYHAGMTLNHEEKQQLLTRIAAFEAATGVQLVTTLQPRCDDYPEIPWKAFAAGTAFGALVAVLDLLFPGFGVLHALVGLTPEMTLVFVLGAGLASGGLSIAVPAYARLFLSAARAEGEVRQAAQALFLEHELFNTRARTGVLMLVAAFEHRVVLLADRGLRARLPAGALDETVAAMTESLRAGAWSTSLMTGIEKLEAMVRAHGLTGHGQDNALPDHLDTHRGEGDAC
jgi:putative membrane protein